jgi:hypothetical protein
MKNKFLILIITIITAATGITAFADKTVKPATPREIVLNAKVEPQKAKIVNEQNYITAASLDIVANPDKYLQKNVKFKAKFDKFSTLGLDYKPAFRDSQKYISFLIKRDDVTDHTIPLSEMKIFIKREDAEKFIDLDSGDVIEVYGKVFSNALTDAWVDVDKLAVVEQKKKT